jgi:hypothetical protein
MSLSAAEIRSTLVDALQLDLVGPRAQDLEYTQETLTQAPSKWYLTGFLVPYGARLEDKSDSGSNEEIDLLTGSQSSEDSQVKETAAARRAPFPSSMGMSVLVPGQTKELNTHIAWADYLPVELDQANAEIEAVEQKDKPIGWQRHPQSAALDISLPGAEGSYQRDIPSSGGLILVVNCRPVNDPRFGAGTRSVSVFVVNSRQMQERQRDREASYAFQVCLTLACAAGFVPRPDLRGAAGTDQDEAIANLQYRQDFEFVVGHNVSALATKEDSSVCTQVCTTWIPEAEVPRVKPGEVPGIELGMEALAKAPDAAAIQKMLSPLVDEYRDWIDRQGRSPIQPPEVQGVAKELLHQAKGVCDRIDAGLKALDDPQVLAAFQIANRAVARSRRQQLSQEIGLPPDQIDPPEWRPFQLAFLLLNLVSMAQPSHKDRKVVDLLFFPTGGGKTEAYLGLAAFTLVLRRLRHPGMAAAGVSVLMRYTLRLLTLDQLERAARLICALELERQNTTEQLGGLPFEIGLWVGQSATPNKMGKKGDKDEYSARERTLDFKRDTKTKPSPIPLERCPWCGEKFDKDSFNLRPDQDTPKHLQVNCVNRGCDFRSHNPLPILAVDESIYTRLPCFVIATVDKFAALPWVGQTAALFGKVTHYHPGEGFYSAVDEKPKGTRVGPLPPPDLIIQDELHLISGPLGTMVGLYETAIDALCTDAQQVRPKVIASTATVRRANRQIQALFGRHEVDIFPPPSPDRHDSFFAKTDFSSPGRLYLGVAAQGRSPKVVLMRTYLALLSAAQKQYDLQGGKQQSPNPADPYMTLLGYFNSLRELGGSRRIVEDEVVFRLSQYDQRLRYGQAKGLFAKRKISNEPEELTSRVSTNKVANTKRRLALDMADKERVDVALATNMISVGLDIVRLGLMVVLGQPKTAAEYIQATSRVGRDPKKPGLVVTLLNVHRPRDRSHYERFASWHNSFYRAVEATSVTPFSRRALDRGLAAITIGLARLGHSAMTQPLGASLIGPERPAVEALIQTICERAAGYSPDLSDRQATTLRQEVRSRILDLLDTWQRVAEREPRLQYQKEVDAAAALLLDPLSPGVEQEPLERQKFKASRSLRDVEPTVNLYVRDPDGQDIKEES